MNKNNNALPQSLNYYSEINKEHKGDRYVYQLINRSTGIVEFETSMLPQLYTVMFQFEEALERFSEDVKPTDQEMGNLLFFNKPTQH